MEYPAERRLLDKLTNIDERVDFIHNQVKTVQGQLDASQLSLNLLLEKEGLPIVAKAQKQFVFKHTVAALAGLIDHRRLPLLKTVKTITIHFPEGCNGLVNVAVGYSQDKRLLPEEGYLALNDATPTWAINKDTDSDTLWVDIRNSDSGNAHTISVIVNYEETA